MPEQNQEQKKLSHGFISSVFFYFLSEHQAYIEQIRFQNRRCKQKHIGVYRVATATKNKAEEILTIFKSFKRIFQIFLVNNKLYEATKKAPGG